MCGYFTIAQLCGSSMVSQWRYAFSRQSSIHCGSFFFLLIKRTISSFSPGGAESASTSVTNPHLYSRFASVSISCSAVGMLNSRVEDRGSRIARLLLRPSILDPRFSTFLGAERRPASAGAGRVRILEHESAAHHLVLEVDLNTIEIQVALHIAQDLYTLRFNLLVGFAFGLFGEV